MRKSSRLLLAVWLTAAVAILCVQSKRHKPKPDEIELIINETHSIIYKCSNTKCKPGYGLSVQCGSSVLISKAILCIPCVEGETYSDVEDYSVCKSCQHCGENQEKSGECTKKYDSTQCLKCKQGFYPEVTDDCHPCSFCCGDYSDDDRIKECEDAGLPPNKQCRASHDPTCQPPSKTDPNNKTLHTENVIEQSTNLPPDQQCRESHDPACQPPSKTEPNGKMHRKENEQSTNLSRGAVAGIVVAVVVVVFIIALIVLWRIGYLYRVRDLFCRFCRFFCCCSNYRSSHRRVGNTIYFDTNENDLESDVNGVTGTYEEDSDQLGPLQKATSFIKSKPKYKRLLSCPQEPVSKGRPNALLRPHSHPGCPENLSLYNVNDGFADVENLRAQIGICNARKDGYTPIATDLPLDEQDPYEEDPVTELSCSSSSAVGSEKLKFGTKGKEDQPNALCAPPRNMSTSTTGLLDMSTATVDVPQEYRKWLMSKKVREIPCEFYIKICYLLNARGAFWDDYRLLGEKVGLDKDQSDFLGQQDNATDDIIKQFDAQKNTCIGKFKKLLEGMNRYDAVAVIEQWIETKWLADQSSNSVTV